MRSPFAKRHFFLLCALPNLGPPGSVPVLNKRELLALVRESKGPTEVVGVLLLGDDLLQHEAVIAGEIELDQADLAVMSHQEINDPQSLPRFLMPAQADKAQDHLPLVAADRIWRRYFHRATKVAQMTRTPFLVNWVGFEVGLRNATAIARAGALAMDPGLCTVAPELADPGLDFDPIVAEWKTAPNPLNRFAVLEMARWDWLNEHEQWYRFSDDEIAAYTVKLMLLNRWRRTSAKGAL
jgi:hypothetical protein